MTRSTVDNMGRMRDGVPFAEWPEASLYDFTDRFDHLPTQPQWDAFCNAELDGWRFIVFDATGHGIVLVKPNGGGGQLRMRIDALGNHAIYA